MADCLYPHPGDHRPHAAEVGYLCKPGFARAEQHIAELPALSSWLHANLASGGAGDSDGSQRTKGEPPIPIRDTVHDHIVEIAAVLTSWAMLVAEERSLRGPRSAEVTTTAPFLLAHLEWAAAQLWVDDLAAEVADLHRTAHSLAPSRPGLHRMPAPCPTCDAVELSRQDGDDRIECRSCGRLWTEDEYVRLVIVLAGEMDLPEWSPVPVVAARFGLPAQTVWAWKRKGLLQSRREGGQIVVRLICDVGDAA